MMKATNNNNCTSNLGTGVKAFSMILIGLCALALAAASLPIILPLLWMFLVMAGGIGVVLGFVWLLGFVVNLCKRKGD